MAESEALHERYMTRVGSDHSVDSLLSSDGIGLFRVDDFDKEEPLEEQEEDDDEEEEEDDDDEARADQAAESVEDEDEGAETAEETAQEYDEDDEDDEGEDKDDCSRVTRNREQNEQREGKDKSRVGKRVAMIPIAHARQGGAEAPLTVEEGKLRDFCQENDGDGDCAPLQAANIASASSPALTRLSEAPPEAPDEEVEESKAHEEAGGALLQPGRHKAEEVVKQLDESKRHAKETLSKLLNTSSSPTPMAAAAAAATLATPSTQAAGKPGPTSARAATASAPGSARRVTFAVASAATSASAVTTASAAAALTPTLAPTSTTTPTSTPTPAGPRAQDQVFDPVNRRPSLRTQLKARRSDVDELPGSTASTASLAGAGSQPRQTAPSPSSILETQQLHSSQKSPADASAASSSPSSSPSPPPSPSSRPSPPSGPKRTTTCCAVL